MKGSGIWMLYLLCAQSEPEIAYFKIGISQQVNRRMMAIKCHCPIPFVSVSLLPAFTYQNARAFERFMHRALEAYRSAGEWFKFNLLDDQSAAVFRAARKELESDQLGALGKWKHFDVEGFLENERAVAAQLSKVRAEQRTNRFSTSPARATWPRHAPPIQIDN